MWQQTTVQIWISNDKYTNTEYRKAFVATIVTNVATERIWLDTPDLEHQTCII
jgi:hypothetical protein